MELFSTKRLCKPWFFHSINISDPEKLLKGTGKSLRQIKFKNTYKLFKTKLEINSFFLKTFMVSITFGLMIGSVYAQKTGSISGTILQKNNKQSLVGATINVAGTNLSTVADSSGRFRILNIPVKTYNLVISSVGFKTFTLYNIVVNSGNENVYTVELEEDAVGLGEVVVTVNKKSVVAASLETPLSVQRLTTEEIKINPGVINLKKLTIDVFLDVTNWYVARNPAIPEYTWQRTADNRTFRTTDGLAIKADGSNAIPTNVKNDEPQVVPTLGVITEF